MPDLVTTNPVPQVRAPETRVSPGEIAQPYQELEGLMRQAGDVLSKDVAEPLARQAGLKAVSRNPETGELQLTPAPIVGDAAVEFHKAVKYSALAQGEAESKQKDLLLSKQFHNDPEGYRVAAAAFRDAHVADYEKKFGVEVSIALGRSIDNATTYNYRWLLNEQQRNIRQDFDRTTKAKISDLDNDISTLMSSGDVSSPTLQAKINERIHLTQLRADSPILGRPGGLETDLKQFDQSVGAWRFAADVNNLIKDKGVEAATRYVESEAVNDKSEPVQRALNYSFGMKAIQDHMATLQKNIHLQQTFQKQSDEGAEDAIIKDSASGNSQITENDIKTNPNMSAASKMRMLNWKKRDDMPEPLARVSEIATQDAMRRMGLPPDDPNAISNLGQIRDLYANKGALRRQDEDWLEKRFIEGRTPEGQQLNKLREQVIKAAALDKSSMMNIDGEGRMRQYRYEWYVDQRVAQYRAEKKNPMDLFDPSKPDFIGKQEIVDYFTSPLPEQAREAARKATGTRPPPPPGLVEPAADETKRKPRESPADYDKRMGLR